MYSATGAGGFLGKGTVPKKIHAKLSNRFKVIQFWSLIYLFIKIRVIKGCRYFTQEQNSKPFHFLYPPDNWSNRDHLQNNLGNGRFIWKHGPDSAFPPRGMSKKQSTRTPSWCFCKLQCEGLSGFNTYYVKKHSVLAIRQSHAINFLLKMSTN